MTTTKAWKRHSFKVHVSNPHEDTGARCGLIRNHFAVHGSAKAGWNVTHLPSGRKIAECGRIATAKIKAEQFEELPINWDNPDPLRDVGDDMRQAMRQIAFNLEAARS